MKQKWSVPFCSDVGSATVQAVQSMARAPDLDGDLSPDAFLSPVAIDELKHPLGTTPSRIVQDGSAAIACADFGWFQSKLVLQVDFAGVQGPHWPVFSGQKIEPHFKVWCPHLNSLHLNSHLNSLFPDAAKFLARPFEKNSSLAVCDEKSE